MFGKKKKNKNAKIAKNVSKKQAATGKKQAAPKKASRSGSVTPEAKKKTAPKGKAKPTELKPDWDFENSATDDSKVIVIKGKKSLRQQPRIGTRKELKRVAKAGGYTVFDGARAGKTFATPQEAKDYAADVLRRTGEVVPVQRTDRQVSHTFKAENKTEK